MPFDIASLPTESLYKFQAFTGLFLSVGTVVYVIKLIDVAKISTLGIEIEINLLNHEIKSVLDPAADRIENELDKLEAYMVRVEKKYPEVTGFSEEERKSFSDEIAKDASEFGEKLARINKQHGDHGELFRVFQVNLIKLQGQNDLIKYQQRKIKLLTIIGILTFALGAVLAITGFSRWQVVQDDIDEAIHNQALNK